MSTMKPSEFMEHGPTPAFPMGHLTRFCLTRRIYEDDPYNPDASIRTYVESAWSRDVYGYLDSGVSEMGPGPDREQVTSRATITFPMSRSMQLMGPGDMLTEVDRRWRVTGVAAQDQNPFTGWQPTLVVEVEEVKG